MRRTAPSRGCPGGLCDLHPSAARSSPTSVPNFRQDWKLTRSTRPRITDVCALENIQTDCHQTHMTRRQQNNISWLIWCPGSGCRLWLDTEYKLPRPVAVSLTVVFEHLFFCHVSIKHFTFIKHVPGKCFSFGTNEHICHLLLFGS